MKPFMATGSSVGPRPVRERKACRGLHSGRGGEKGFTYVWMMFSVALVGIALAGAGQVWRIEARREKEKELMFVGEQFRRAIGSYYENSPGMPKRYPDSLDKLLADKRFPVVRRHLRKIFFDPMTGKNEWGMIRRPGVGLVGVHSLSVQVPLKRANFIERYAEFSDAKSYRDWKFVYLPGDTGSPQSQPGTGAQPEPDVPPTDSSAPPGIPPVQPEPGGQPVPPHPASQAPPEAPASSPFSPPYSSSSSSTEQPVKSDSPFGSLP